MKSLVNILRKGAVAAVLLALGVANSYAQSCPNSVSQTFTVGQNQQTFTLTYLSYTTDGTNTTVCYDLASSPTPSISISHFVLGVCDDLGAALVGATYNGSPVSTTVGPDPTTGLSGVKIDTAFPGEYCFTFAGTWALGCTEVALKQGNATTPLIQDIVGLDCGGGTSDPNTTISGFKWYDADVDGIKDPSEVGIPGWQIEVCVDADGPNGPSPETCTIVLTDATGEYSVLLQPGWYYEISEVYPVEDHWFQTAPPNNLYTGQVTTSAVSGLDFGNVCLGGGGGRTMGFWSNKNGQALVGADDLAMLVALNLRAAGGAHFDPATYGGYRSWLLNATATNMAYMLSAQLSAMALNVYNGLVDGNSLVYAPGVGNTGVGNNFITVNDLIAAADAALAADGYTPAGDPNRYLQALLKNALDDANNNQTFVQPSPCPFTFPAP